jgi:hypothetical protein
MLLSALFGFGAAAELGNQVISPDAAGAVDWARRLCMLTAVPHAGNQRHDISCGAERLWYITAILAPCCLAALRACPFRCCAAPPRDKSSLHLVATRARWNLANTVCGVSSVPCRNSSPCSVPVAVGVPFQLTT